MTSSLRPLVFLLCLPVTLAAQEAATTAAPPDSLYQRAARLVRDGRGDAGRALVDSLLAATPDGDPAYGEGLYWRAALATSAAGAERDYKRVIVEYPASPRAEEALLTLAQLELARGDRERALAHLQRLQLEHPNSAQRARASLWAARAWFDLRDAVKACAAVADARASMAASDVELKNQVDFLSSRCPVVAEGQGTRDEVRDGKRDETTPPAAKPAPAAPAPAPVSSSPSPSRTSSPVPRPSYTIQVAAYDKRADAEALVKRLAKRGYKARVVGTGKPFRVRIGSYATQGEASIALRKMKSAGLTGFIAEGEGP